jgi:DNA helicase-2/ATP-dependent DNA helicase PcrA
MTFNFTPRPSQSQILRYRGGHLGIAAVPGAGKTQILSKLAADIIMRGQLGEGQEVLIVTLVNSAVDNFEGRIKRFFANPVQALYKYRVRTLHGLAHDIVREKPARVGLEERFAIIDDREADFIRREAVNSWLSASSHSLEDLLDPSMDASRRDWVRRQQLPEMISSLALAFIRSAKDRRITPDKLRRHLEHAPGPLPLVQMGLAIYSDYQRALAYRAAVDFDDLIRLALDLLELDPEYLQRLRYRFPFILEDEAQDSSRLQQDILALLSGPRGNWVRVGDPNQAIFETFTTASPELLRSFIRDNPSVDMPESGRSQPAVIELANHLVDWVMNDHPVQEARSALAPPYVQPTPPGDPQPNPPEDRSAIHLVTRRMTPEEEVNGVADSLARWLPGHRDRTVAVLVPRNARGVELIDALKHRGIEYLEYLTSTSNTRAAAGALSSLIGYLSDPSSAAKLSRAYRVWRRDWREDAVAGEAASITAGGNADLAPVIPEPVPTKEQTSEVTAARQALLSSVTTLLRKTNQLEAYVAPGPENDWLAALRKSEPASVIEELEDFRLHVSRWLDAVTLPIDQLLLTLAQDVFTNVADLALAQKLASVLRRAADDHPEWRLPELTAELAVIARNERRFIGFSVDDTGFDPERHRGKVVVTTLHKAKGLEWDRVYIMSVNNYDFPSSQPNDRYISEKWFMRGALNLEAEALAQLQASLTASPVDWYVEGAATNAARLDYVKERLRLLYVGITRARHELFITWNTGRQGNLTLALPLSAMMGYTEKWSS